MCVGGGGGQDVITIQTSTMHDPAIGYSITCVDRYWQVGRWLQMHFTLTMRVGICVR